MSNTLMPKIDHLAWAPLPTVDGVDILDRYNGVPTLGIIRTGNEAHLFWRVYGYHTDTSLWLYIPLTPEDEAHLDTADGPDMLNGIVYDRDTSRMVSFGMASRNRLIFDREWSLPAGLKPDGIVHQLAEFALEAADIRIAEGLPSSRRDIVVRARETMRELAAC